MATSLAPGQRVSGRAEVFKSRSDLVLVPTVVLKSGEPVRGLKARNFRVLHDNKREEVAVFEEIEAVPARVEPVKAAGRSVQNYAPASAHQDVVILLLDFLNSSWTTRARISGYVRSDLVRQFGGTRTPVTVLVLAFRGLVQVHSFTSDPEDLARGVKTWISGSGTSRALAESPGWSSPLAATEAARTAAMLERSLARPPIAPPSHYAATLLLEKAAMTLESLEQIANAFRGVPGRRKLIWISTGFPSLKVLGQEPSADAETEFRIADKTARAWRALSDANIVVYPVDSNGVTNPAYADAGTSPGLPAATSFEEPSNSGSMMEAAEKTGGLFCTDLPSRCVDYVQADATHYYLLGFYLHGDTSPGWHKLKVEVDDPGAAVRARDGFAVGELNGRSHEYHEPVKGLSQSSEDDDAVMTALISPLDYTSVPLALQWSILEKPTGNADVELVLTSPPGGVALSEESGSLNVDFLAFFWPIGRTEGRTFPKTLVTTLAPGGRNLFSTRGFAFRKQVSLPPDRYELRVLLRDNIAHKIGTVSTTMDLRRRPH